MVDEAVELAPSPVVETCALETDVVVPAAFDEVAMIIVVGIEVAALLLDVDLVTVEDAATVAVVLALEVEEDDWATAVLVDLEGAADVDALAEDLAVVLLAEVVVHNVEIRLPSRAAPNRLFDGMSSEIEHSSDKVF